jgi:hypothetical protein
LGNKVKKNEMGGACNPYGGEERCIQILVGDLGEGYHLEDPGEDGRVILKSIFKKWDWGAWTGLIWIRMGTGGRLL